MIRSFNKRMLELSTAGTRLSRGGSDLTDYRASVPSQSSVDEPNRGLPSPVNDLVVTVLAPSAALSHWNGQIRAIGMDGLFVYDTRALTEVSLRFGGAEPHPLAVLQDGPGRTRFIGVAHGFGDPINDPTVRIDR